jgi:hypothetical protein
MCAMRALVVSCLVALVSAIACSHPPPPPLPTAEKPVAVFADVAGHWVTSDDLDWSYALALGADGDFRLTLDRGKIGRCEVHAKLVQAAVAPKFELEVALDECHRDRAAGPIVVAFPSFTGTALTVELTDAGQTDRHTFTRAPAPSMQ